MPEEKENKRSPEEIQAELKLKDAETRKTEAEARKTEAEAATTGSTRACPALAKCGLI